MIWSASPTCNATDAARRFGDIDSSGISVTVAAATLTALTVHWNFTPVQGSSEGKEVDACVPSLSQGFQARCLQEWVLFWRNDLDEWRTDLEELIQRCVFSLTASTHDAVRCGKHGLLRSEIWEAQNKQMSFICPRFPKATGHIWQQGCVAHLTSNGPSHHQLVKTLEIVFCVCDVRCEQCVVVLAECHT